MGGSGFDNITGFYLRNLKCSLTFKGGAGGSNLYKLRFACSHMVCQGQYFLLPRVPCDCRKWGK